MGTTPQQTLKLGYTIGAGLEIVPKLLRTYRERQPSAGIETEEFDFTDPSAGLRDNLVNAAVVRPPLGLAGLVSVELATERLVACLPEIIRSRPGSHSAWPTCCPNPSSPRPAPRAPGETTGC